ncbi:MAG: hypothetical protein ACJAQ6_001765 [Arenicella sp.]|jgi:hypothetical protein
MKYQLADHVSLTEVDDEAVLLDLHSGGYFGLNHIGAQLMSHLQQQQTIEFASTSIAEQYQTPEVTVSRDIHLLVQQLLDQKLIVAV